MLHRTTKKCWKCGQEVPHHRSFLGKRWTGWGRSLFSWVVPNMGDRHPLRAKRRSVPKKHYVEKGKGFIECPGSGRAA